MFSWDYIFIFLFGICFGSFLNVVIWRLQTEEGLGGRSYCPECNHQLNWRDLIPVASFFILRRKCRYCEKPISWQYPLVEIFTGLIFVLIFNFKIPVFSAENVFLNFQYFFAVFYWLLIAGSLIVIFVYDFKHYIIPDKIIFPGVAVAFLYQIVSNVLAKNAPLNFKSIVVAPIVDWKFSILSAFAAVAFFLFIALVSYGKWMGLGDVKLVFFLGLLLGYPDILAALFLAFFIGSIIGLGLIIAKKKEFKSEIPFGPFLITGAFIALFWGENLIRWYLGYIR